MKIKIPKKWLKEARKDPEKFSREAKEEWDKAVKYLSKEAGMRREPERVWMRISDAQLGYVCPDTVFGDVWFYAEHKDSDVLNERFCNFIEDKWDPNSHKKTDFIDLGVL